jgi:hypothetical protein
MSTEPERPEIVVETVRTRAFASALAWPGWSRAGKDEGLALEALVRYAPRYARVVAKAGMAFPEPATTAELDVVERTEGNASTTFGVPGRVAERDLHRVSSAEARRLVDIVIACWAVLDEVAAGAPAELRKGPRGGGRDRDEVVTHVETAERAYASKMGIRLPDSTPITEVRGVMIEVLGLSSDGSPLPGGAWTQRYAARRVAWHLLDHAWEIEDRSASS